MQRNTYSTKALYDTRAALGDLDSIIRNKDVPAAVHENAIDCETMMRVSLDLIKRDLAEYNEALDTRDRIARKLELLRDTPRPFGAYENAILAGIAYLPLWEIFPSPSIAMIEVSESCGMLRTYYCYLPTNDGFKVLCNDNAWRPVEYFSDLQYASIIPYGWDHV